MPGANLPPNEQDRLSNLYSYELLDTLPEKDYDDITKLASQICDTPISLVTLLDSDRQWFKSAHGTDLQQTFREHAFCSHAILKPYEIMVVPDAVHDERFSNNPLVTQNPHIGFYAGVPLMSDEGFAIGSLCVLDNKPRELSELQQQSLKILANQVMRLIQLHKKNKELVRGRLLLQEVNKELEKFVKTTADNLKVPCDNAIEFTNLVTEKLADNLDADSQQLLTLVKYSCEGMKTTIDKTLQQANMISILQDSKTIFTFSGLMQEMKQLLPHYSGDISLNYLPNSNNIYFFKKILLQILTNVITASVQFNNKEQQFVEVAYRHNREQYIFTITDNGMGAPVFSRNGGFAMLPMPDNPQDNSHYTSHLNQAKKLVVTLSGKLDINFEENRGTTFTISIPK